MAAPTTKKQWQEYCGFHPTPDDERPDLTLTEIRRLTDQEREEYNDRRIRYLDEERILPTRDVMKVEATARRCLRAANAPRFTARRGMSVSGPSRIGKTTAVMWAAKAMEKLLRERNNRVDDPDYLPVVYVSIGAATTPNKLWAVLAEFVGTRQLRGRNSDGRMFDLVRILGDLGTRLVVIDEVQRVNTDRVSGAEVADTLKTFAEQLDAVMIYAGISLGTAPLFTGEAGKQWRARTVPVEMHGYSLRSKDKRKEWQELVATFERYLPLAQHEPGSLVLLADHLFHLTGGSLAALHDLLADAGAEAIETGEEQITRELLNKIADHCGAGGQNPDTHDVW